MEIRTRLQHFQALFLKVGRSSQLPLEANEVRLFVLDDNTRKMITKVLKIKLSINDSLRIMTLLFYFPRLMEEGN